MIKDGWYYCPVCRKKKVQPVEKETTIKNASLFCKMCGNSSYPVIENGKEIGTPRIVMRERKQF